MTKFYLAKISNIDKPIEIEQENVTFEFINSSKKEIIITGSIKEIRENNKTDSYYFLQFLGGQKDPYNNRTIDTQNKNTIKDNPRPKEEPEVSIEYYYLIDKTNGYVLGEYASFQALIEFYKNCLNQDIKISYFIPDIDDYLNELNSLSECKIKGEISPQELLVNFGDKYHTDEIEKLGFGIGSTAELKITSGKTHDLNKFKKHIKKYNLQFVTIKGKNDRGHDISYYYGAIKPSYELEIDDNLATKLKNFLKDWLEDHALENKKS